MESNLDLNAILKAAGASIIQRRPEHADLVYYHVQLLDKRTLAGWEFENYTPYTFAEAKEMISELQQIFPQATFRIVAIVEVK